MLLLLFHLQNGRKEKKKPFDIILEEEYNLVYPTARRICSIHYEVPDQDPFDLVQGVVGSCWYSSALSALTARPYFFNKLFCPANLHHQPGLHIFHLCLRGRWVHVHVDDLLPTNRRRALVFTRTARNQFYPALIEKALAKVYGSYAALDKGTCAEGLQTLTGQPCQIVSFTKKNRGNCAEIEYMSSK